MSILISFRNDSDAALVSTRLQFGLQLPIQLRAVENTFEQGQVHPTRDDGEVLRQCVKRTVAQPDLAGVFRVWLVPALAQLAREVAQVAAAERLARPTTLRPRGRVERV